MKKILRVGLWGLGRAGQKMHMKEIGAFPENFKIICGYDNDSERRKTAKQNFPELHIYSSCKAFLTDPEIDMIVIGTRSPLHVSHALKALEAGKYVVCEKPIAATVAQAEKLRAADKKYPGKLFIRHNRRYETAFTHIREIIASGKLGYIYEVKLRRHNFQWRTDWQTISKCFGGQLLNWGPHLIDHALQFLEAPVESQWSDLKLVAACGDAEDHFKLLLRGTNGRIVDVEVSGGVPLPEAVYCIHGTRGTLISPDEKVIKMKYLRQDKPIPEYISSPENPGIDSGFGPPVPKEWWVEEEFPVKPAKDEHINKHFLHVWEAIVEGKEYPITIDQAIEVVRVTERARRCKIDDMKKSK